MSVHWVFFMSVAVACCCFFLLVCGGEDGENNMNTMLIEDMGGENNLINGLFVVFLSSMLYVMDVGFDGLDEVCNVDEVCFVGLGMFKVFVGVLGCIFDVFGCDDILIVNNVWVFVFNMSYVIVDGEVLFMINDFGIFDDQGYLMGNVMVGGVINFVMVFDKNWCYFEDDDCNGWSSDMGEMCVGWMVFYGGVFFDGGGFQCGLVFFVCVE